MSCHKLGRSYTGNCASPVLLPVLQYCDFPLLCIYFVSSMSWMQNLLENRSSVHIGKKMLKLHGNKLSLLALSKSKLYFLDQFFQIIFCNSSLAHWFWWSYHTAVLTRISVVQLSFHRTPSISTQDRIFCYKIVSLISCRSSFNLFCILDIISTCSHFFYICPTMAFIFPCCFCYLARNLHYPNIISSSSDTDIIPLMGVPKFQSQDDLGKSELFNTMISCSQGSLSSEQIINFKLTLKNPAPWRSVILNLKSNKSYTFLICIIFWIQGQKETVVCCRFLKRVNFEFYFTQLFFSHLTI